MIVQNIILNGNPLPLYGECGCCKNLGKIGKFCECCKETSLYQWDNKKHAIAYKVFWEKGKGLRHYSPEQPEIKIGKCYISISGGRTRLQIYKIKETNQFSDGVAAYDIFEPFFQTPVSDYNLAEIGKCYVRYKDRNGNNRVLCFEDDVEQAIHFSEQIDGEFQELQIHLGKN